MTYIPSDNKLMQWDFPDNWWGKVLHFIAILWIGAGLVMAIGGTIYVVVSLILTGTVKPL